MELHPLSISSPGLLAVAAALSILTILLAWRRRPDAPPLALAAAGAALLLLCLAAGGLHWNRPAAREVAVLVDLSPSTRPATYRNYEHLEARLQQLLGGTPYRVYAFVDEMREIRLANQPARLPDLPADRTTLAPPPAAAILLFSDGQFDPPPASPPVYPVLDPQLENPPDAAVASLEQQGDMLLITVRNTGPPRELTITGTAGPSPVTVPAGSHILTRRLLDDATSVTARLDGGDDWPENDLLSLSIPAPPLAQWWWISQTAPPDERWRNVSPQALPTDPNSYLDTAAIVIDNLPAAALSAIQQRRLRQYVSDLGGALIILGGDSAHAAGGYIGTTIESLSPLASAPPAPTVHWILLADSSGSMAAPAGPVTRDTRWQRAAAAITTAIAHLPPDDLLSLGSFAREVNWWTTGRPARAAAAERFPPTGTRPHGPTNLEPALREVLRQMSPNMQNELLILTDAEVRIDNAQQIVQLFQDRNLSLHVLAVEPGGGEVILQQIAEQTGGSFMRELNPQQWMETVSHMLQTAMPRHLHDEPLTIDWTAEIALPPTTAAPWNRTWLKDSAQLLAHGAAANADAPDTPIPAAARWQLGAGEVIAIAFRPSQVESLALADSIARLPHDPRFAVSWDHAPQLRITIDATEDGQYLNNLALELHLLPTPGQNGAATRLPAHQTLPIPQTAPGQYSLERPPPRIPTIATIHHNGQIIRRFPLPGRYAPEFNHIGTNHDTLQALARRTGGDIIPPHHTEPIDFRWPPRRIPLQAPLATAAAALLAIALIIHRRAAA